MAVPDYCVPEPCTFTNPPCMPGAHFEWCLIKDKAVTNNTIYSVGYLTGKYLPFVTEGVTTLVEDKVTSWFLRFTVVQAAPYFITLLILFIVLMITRVISLEIGIILIVIMLVLAILAIVWVLYDTGSSLVNLRTEVGDQITANWHHYGTDIAKNLSDALTNPCNKQCYKCTFPADNCSCIPNACPPASTLTVEEVPAISTQ